MLATFSSVTPYLKFNAKRVTIDNLVFKLHYRWTFVLLIVSTLLVTSRQYIGEHIKCISDSIPAHVINTYCFFTPTFTMVRHFNNTALAMGAIFEPGIGPFEHEEDPVKHHAYYQWVPFVLFGQALTFYIPHALWKSFEGGRIKSLVFGMKMVGITKYLKSKSHQIGHLDCPTTEETEARVRNIRRTMVDRMRLNQSWGAHLVFCEFLNLVNLMVQVYWTNRFLGGQFLTLGPKVLAERWTEKMDALDVIFPKVTKCHFYKYGASGSLQKHDTLCVMALNIINEKIYTILWFWYVFVVCATVLGLMWRGLTLLFYKNAGFSKFALYVAKPGRIDNLELKSIIAKCNFSNWMFLYFLKCNLSEFLFKKVMFHLASEFPDDSSDNTLNALLDQEQEAGTSRMQTMRIDDVDAPHAKAKQT